MPKDESPAMPSLIVGSGMVYVESITGHGVSLASVVLRVDGQRLAAEPIGRERLVNFALGLLKLSQQMVDERAYLSSDTVQDGLGAVSTRHKDGLKRYYRLKDRLPILQLAQRVLESADDDTASTLLALLASADATGRLPVSVRIDVQSTQDSGTEADNASSAAAEIEPVH